MNYLTQPGNSFNSRSLTLGGAPIPSRRIGTTCMVSQVSQGSAVVEALNLAAKEPQASGLKAMT